MPRTTILRCMNVTIVVLAVTTLLSLVKGADFQPANLQLNSATTPPECQDIYEVCIAGIDAFEEMLRSEGFIGSEESMESLSSEGVCFEDAKSTQYQTCEDKARSCKYSSSLDGDDTEKIYLVGTPEENISIPLTELEYCWTKELLWNGRDTLEDGTHLRVNRQIDCSTYKEQGLIL